MKIAVHVPTYKRHNILNKFFTYGDIPACCDIYAIVSTPEDKELCEAFGATCFEYPNQPLSIKLQKGLEWCKQFDFDALLCVGSDDIIFGLEHYIKYLDKHDFVAVQDCYLRDNATGETYYWDGYKGGDRQGEPVGAGRMFRRDLLDRMDWLIWDSPRVSSVDRIGWARIKQYSQSMKCMKGEAKLIDLKDEYSTNKLHLFTDYEQVELKLPDGL